MDRQTLRGMLSYTEQGYYESALLMTENLYLQHIPPKEIQQAFNHLLTKRDQNPYGIELKTQLETWGQGKENTKGARR